MAPGVRRRAEPRLDATADRRAGGPGFDTFFGIHASLDIPPYYYIRDRAPLAPPTERVEASNTEGWTKIQGAFWRAGATAPDFDHEDVLPRFGREATRYIDQRARVGKQPFFLYVALTAPHTPWLPAEQFRGRSGADMYGDFMAQVDDTVGQILRALDRHDLAENTLVIFSSDNGPVWYPDDVERFGHSSTGPLRGMKGDAYEGGHRVPFVLRWPETVDAGRVSDQTICFTDMMATFADVARVPLAEGAGEDSESIVPLLLDRSDAPVRDVTVLKANGSVVREGRWKLIKHLGSGGFSKPRRVKPEEGGPEGQLYDLDADVGETNNLWSERPDVVARLMAYGEKPAPARAPQVSKSEQTDKVFGPWNKPTSPGCAVGVIQNGVLVHRRGYGMANLEYGEPLTAQSVFRIASVSKQFTAACMALLVEQGRLELDDSVRVYLPELPAYADAITLRHMLHHTSGLPEYLTLLRRSGEFARPLDFFDEREALASVAKSKRPEFEPGERYDYSNTNYFLMSLIVDRVAGQSLRAFAADNIFTPLGMASSHFHDDVTAVVPRRATGYRKAGEGFAIDETQLEIVGDGGVFTTIEDLARWDQNFYDNRLGRGGRTLIDTLETPGVLNDGDTITYALGLGVDSYRGWRMVSHGGSWAGFRTYMARFPEQRLSVICLCNLADIDPGELATRVADIWLPESTGR